MSRTVLINAFLLVAMLAPAGVTAHQNKRMPQIKRRIESAIARDLGASAKQLTIRRDSRLDSGDLHTLSMINTAQPYWGRAYIVHAKVKGAQRGQGVGKYLVTEVQTAANPVAWQVTPLGIFKNLTSGKISAGKYQATVDRNQSGFFGAEVKSVGTSQAEQIGALFSATNTGYLATGSVLPTMRETFGQIAALQYGKPGSATVKVIVTPKASSPAGGSARPKAELLLYRLPIAPTTPESATAGVREAGTTANTPSGVEVVFSK
ncbi:MAG: hypothetical protein H6707_18960 [Deltaproteobacteria bacterium]|nr:hypothetical protein [Deltaproteobacteria bacterium]